MVLVATLDGENNRACSLCGWVKKEKHCAQHKFNHMTPERIKEFNP